MEKVEGSPPSRCPALKRFQRLIPRVGDVSWLPGDSARLFPDESSPLHFSLLEYWLQPKRVLQANLAKERVLAPGAAWPTGSQSASCRSLILLKPVLSSFPSAVKTARSGRAPS